MTKAEYMRRLLNLELEGENLKDRAELAAQTSEFLTSETDKLDAVIDDPNKTWEERNEATKKLESLIKRMAMELEFMNKIEKDLQDHALRFREMKKLFKQIEDL